MKDVEVDLRKKSAGAAGEEDEGDEAQVICFHGERHPYTYAEMDNLLKVHYKIVFMVGYGNVLNGASSKQDTDLRGLQECGARSVCHGRVEKVAPGALRGPRRSAFL